MQGPTNIRIPPNTQTQQLFRLIGKGLPDSGQERRGDLHIRVIVELPQGLTPAQQNLVQMLAEDLTIEQTPKRESLWESTVER